MPCRGIVVSVDILTTCPFPSDHKSVESPVFLHFYSKTCCVPTIRLYLTSRQVTFLDIIFDYVEWWELPSMWVMGTCAHWSREHSARAGPRFVGAPGRFINWRPLKQIIFKLFRTGTGLEKLLRASADSFHRNSFACGNSVLQVTYFRLF